MSHIFVSYSHKDTDYAHSFADLLHNMGFDVWIDDRLDYGSAWPQEIQKQLDSCTAFIVIMTPRSFESEWVQNELSRAKRLKKKIFPLLLEGDGPWLSVESTQTADVRDGKFPREKFYTDLEEVIPRKGGMTPQPRYDRPEEQPRKVNVPLLGGIGIVALLILGGLLYGKIGSSGAEKTPMPTLTVTTVTETASITPPSPDPTTPAILTPADIPSLPTTTSIPTLSSDFWISYTTNVNGNQDIYLLNPATGDNEWIIVDPSHDKVGTWSPDGNLLAFESNRNTSYYQIFLYNSLQGTVTQLTDFDDCSNWAPNWASTGSKIVFYSNCENKQRDIYIMNRDGSGRTRLTKDNGENKFPVFSPDNNQITFTSTRKGKDQIYIMNVDGSDQRLIADGCNSSFSPDGDWLWFTTSCDDSDIKRVRVDGSDLEIVGSIFGGNPVVSPDGFFVAFESGGDIWVMRVDGSDLEQLTSGNADDSVPSWTR
ncbi:MAG TPA: TIR domain-containing protein [Anaerolineales bacterium]|nr:TIR domain-containing protein [Anaerolineales bacterium]